MFFQKAPAYKPLGPLLREAREALGLSLDGASLAAGVVADEIRSLEADQPLESPFARLTAVAYARSLGIDPLEIRESLPPMPELLPRKSGYISNMARPTRPRWRLSVDILVPLAPLGRAVLYLLITATLLSTWGMMRQLSRVRSIPWITSNNHFSSFQVR